ncbi:MAG: hypothetical protein JO329_21170 [Planctomycetaceae bacterium]|nr:hypothetical protein [Planctomycetaceae bacterium]
MGILSMGWAFWSVDHVSNPTLEVHPHDRSRPFRLAFRSVNLKVADLAQFGTFPRDPLEEQNPKYGGRWLAAFAPVGGTELVVVVQRRYDEAVAPDLTLALDSFLGGGVALTLIAIAVGIVGYTGRRVAGWRARRGGEEAHPSDGLTPPLPC